MDLIPPAGPAQSGDGQGEILYLEPNLNLRRYLDPVQALVMAIHDRVAADADQMVVTARVGIEACLSPRVADLGNHTKPYERFQHPIYGRSGNTSDEPSDGIIELIRRRMIGAGSQCFKDDPPLHGKGQPLLAAETFQLRHFCINKSLPYHGWN